MADVIFQKLRLEVSDLAKMKTGFAIRFLTEEIDEDKSQPEELFDHNRAALAYLWDVQEAADKSLDGGKSTCPRSAQNSV